jgi:GNAT superfamily N-acetyltransferase
MIRISKINSEEDKQIAKDILLEYAEMRNFDAALGDFDKEISEFPGKYSRPTGSFLLIFSDNEPAGCVAIRAIDDEYCEMKRLYVKDKYLGRKIGKALVLGIINEARQKGYKKMRLDTHPWMKEAESLYRSVGFKEIEAYWKHPIDGAKFFELDLGEGNAIH